MKKLILLMLLCVTVKAETKLKIIDSNDHIVITAEGSPAGMGIALLISTDLKEWTLAEDLEKNHCLVLLPAIVKGRKIIRWHLPKNKREFYKVTFLNYNKL